MEVTFVYKKLYIHMTQIHIFIRTYIGACIYVYIQLLLLCVLFAYSLIYYVMYTIMIILCMLSYVCVVNLDSKQIHCYVVSIFRVGG